MHQRWRKLHGTPSFRRSDANARLGFVLRSCPQIDRFTSGDASGLVLFDIKFILTLKQCNLCNILVFYSDKTLLLRCNFCSFKKPFQMIFAIV